MALCICFIICDLHHLYLLCPAASNPVLPLPFLLSLLLQLLHNQVWAYLTQQLVNNSGGAAARSSCHKR
jgi:hypothetical protein